MTTTKTMEPRQLTQSEITDDFKRAIIALLLGQRTWSSKDLNRTFTVAEVAERICRP